MADLLSLIYTWFFEWFINPIYIFIEDFANGSLNIHSVNGTPIVITMPGSNTPLITTNLGDLFILGGSIFLFIGSIICFIAVLKFFYKMGKSLFGGRR